MYVGESACVCGWGEMYVGRKEGMCVGRLMRVGGGSGEGDVRGGEVYVCGR